MSTAISAKDNAATGESCGASLTLSWAFRPSKLRSSRTRQPALLPAQGISWSAMSIDAISWLSCCAWAGGHLGQSRSGSPPSAMAQGCRTRFSHITTKTPKARCAQGVFRRWMLYLEFKRFCLCESVVALTLYAETRREQSEIVRTSHVNNTPGRYVRVKD